MASPELAKILAFMEESQVQVIALTKLVMDQKLQIANLVKDVGSQSALIRDLRSLITDSMKHISAISTVVSNLPMDSAPSPGVLHDAVDLIDEKLKTYAEAAKNSHIAFMETKEAERTLVEEEKRNQQLRLNNCKLSGLLEGEKEDTKEVVTTFIQTQLKVHDVPIVQAFRLGQKKEGFTRSILIKFSGESAKSKVFANRAMLKGQRIWLDDDLTPAQAQAKRAELEKVKIAKEQGWIAFLRNGQAVITQKKKTVSK